MPQPLTPEQKANAKRWIALYKASHPTGNIEEAIKSLKASEEAKEDWLENITDTELEQIVESLKFGWVLAPLSDSPETSPDTFISNAIRRVWDAAGSALNMAMWLTGCEAPQIAQIAQEAKKSFKEGLKNYAKLVEESKGKTLEQFKAALNEELKKGTPLYEPLNIVQDSQNFKISHNESTLTLTRQSGGPSSGHFRLEENRGSFTGVLNVARANSDGEIDEKNSDIVHFVNGKVVSVILAGEGECRLSNIGELINEQQRVVTPKREMPHGMQASAAPAQGARREARETAELSSAEAAIRTQTKPEEAEGRVAIIEQLSALREEEMSTVRAELKTAKESLDKTQKKAVEIVHSSEARARLAVEEEHQSTYSLISAQMVAEREMLNARAAVQRLEQQLTQAQERSESLSEQIRANLEIIKRPQAQTRRTEAQEAELTKAKDSMAAAERERKRSDERQAELQRQLDEKAGELRLAQAAAEDARRALGESHEEIGRERDKTAEALRKNRQLNAQLAEQNVTLDQTRADVETITAEREALKEIDSLKAQLQAERERANAANIERFKVEKRVKALQREAVVDRATTTAKEKSTKRSLTLEREKKARSEQRLQAARSMIAQQEAEIARLQEQQGKYRAELEEMGAGLTAQQEALARTQTKLEEARAANVNLDQQIQSHRTYSQASDIQKIRELEEAREEIKYLEGQVASQTQDITQKRAAHAATQSSLDLATINLAARETEIEAAQVRAAGQGTQIRSLKKGRLKDLEDSESQARGGLVSHELDLRNALMERFASEQELLDQRNAAELAHAESIKRLELANREVTERLAQVELQKKELQYLYKLKALELESQSEKLGTLLQSTEALRKSELDAARAGRQVTLAEKDHLIQQIEERDEALITRERLLDEAEARLKTAVDAQRAAETEQEALSEKLKAELTRSSASEARHQGELQRIRTTLRTSAQEERNTLESKLRDEYERKIREIHPDSPRPTHREVGVGNDLKESFDIEGGARKKIDAVEREAERLRQELADERERTGGIIEAQQNALIDVHHKNLEATKHLDAEKRKTEEQQRKIAEQEDIITSLDAQLSTARHVAEAKEGEMIRREHAIGEVDHLKSEVQEKDKLSRRLLKAAESAHEDIAKLRQALPKGAVVIEDEDEEGKKVREVRIHDVQWKKGSRTRD